MESVLNNDTLSFWLLNYGSFALFVLLALGIVALPVPDETLMVTAGILMDTGHLNIPETILAAYLGSMCGITGSYIIGRTAGHLVHRYGKWFHITEERLAYAHQWFERFGKWTLSIGYFIPGVRHFTGLLAGMTELKYGTFALFAYTGAVIWATFFLSVGYFLGGYLPDIFRIIEVDFDVILIVVALIIAGYLIYRLRKSPK